MRIFQRALEILKEPRAFFRHLNEKGLKTAWIYYAVVSLITVVLATIVGYFTMPVSVTMTAKLFNIPTAALTTATTIGFGWTVFMAILNYAVRLGTVFIGMAILYAWIYIFGGRAGYTKTFQLGVYASTPAYLLGWIPFVGFIGNIWSLVLIIIGTREVHKLSRIKSILMYVIPVMILLIFWTAAIALLAVMSRTTR